MKRFFVKFMVGISAALLIAQSCERVEVPRVDEEEEKYVEKSLYCTLVSYETGYDWRKDSLGGNVDSRLVLLRKDEFVCSVAVPSEQKRTVDPDMHKIVGGALYTIHYIDGVTVFMKNGLELFSIEGKNEVLSWVVHGEDIYSVTKASGGFIYRCNDSILLLSTAGQMLGDLYVDMDTVCMSYSEKMESTSSVSSYRYYFVEGEKRSQFTLMPTVTSILAARRCGGVMNTLQKETGVDGLVWYTPERSIVITDTGASDRNHSFVYDGKNIYAHLQISERKTALGVNYNWSDWFWTMDMNSLHTSLGNQMIALSEENGHLLFVSSPGGRSYPLFVHNGDKASRVSDSLQIISTDAICSDKDKWYLGLSGRSYLRPGYFDGTTFEALDYNGYITRLSLQ